MSFIDSFTKEQEQKKIGTFGWDPIVKSNKLLVLNFLNSVVVDGYNKDRIAKIYKKEDEGLNIEDNYLGL